MAKAVFPVKSLRHDSSSPVASSTAPALNDKLAVKRETVGLYEQVGAAEARQGELQAPQQERDRLLAQVKEDI